MGWPGASSSSGAAADGEPYCSSIPGITAGGCSRSSGERRCVAQALRRIAAGTQQAPDVALLGAVTPKRRLAFLAEVAQVLVGPGAPADRFVRYSAQVARAGLERGSGARRAPGHVPRADGGGRQPPHQEPMTSYEEQTLARSTSSSSPCAQPSVARCAPGATAAPSQTRSAVQFQQACAAHGPRAPVTVARRNELLPVHPSRQPVVPDPQVAVAPLLIRAPLAQRLVNGPGRT